MSADAPGGTVGCDVCGLDLDAAASSAHRAWHRSEDERLARLEGDRDPGGGVGCDVCGIELVAERVDAHRRWHDAEDERLRGIERAVADLTDQVRSGRS